ncbi:MAG: hypothetical protein QM775_01660 [Pirellulales bacterium]
MTAPLSRRTFAVSAAGVLLSAAGTSVAEDKPAAATSPASSTSADAKPTRQPTEAPFVRDYPEPDFKPSWKRPQLPRQLVQDFVIYAHMDLPMTKQLLEKEPGLIAATINWGAGDWESALNAGAHMGRRDIVEYLLENGARIDIFSAAMLGMLDVTKAFLTLQPKLIDAKGPHGFSLHFHAEVGGPEAEPVLEYLQTVKKIELKPNPFLKMRQATEKKT